MPGVRRPARAKAVQREGEEREMAAVGGVQTYLVYEGGDSTGAAVAPCQEIEQLVEARWRAT